MKRVAIAFILACAATHASAKDDVIIGSWRMGEGDTTCSMYTGNNDRRLFIDYNYSLNKVKVAVGSIYINSLSDDDKKNIKMQFISLGKRDIDEGWGETEFIARLIPPMTHLVSNFDAREFMADLAKYDLIGFKYGDAIIGSFDLKGSALVVEKLTECARRRAIENPSDPFGN